MHRKLLPDARLESLHIDKPVAKRLTQEKTQEYHRNLKIKDAEEDAQCVSLGNKLLSYKEKRSRDKEEILID